MIIMQVILPRQAFAKPVVPVQVITSSLEAFSFLCPVPPCLGFCFVGYPSPLSLLLPFSCFLVHYQTSGVLYPLSLFSHLNYYYLAFLFCLFFNCFFIYLECINENYEIVFFLFLLLLFHFPSLFLPSSFPFLSQLSSYFQISLISNFLLLFLCYLAPFLLLSCCVV